MDLPTLIKLLVILAVIILPAINRMVAQMREQRGAMQGPPRPKPGQNQPIRSEIEEFRRRSSQGTSETVAKQSPPRRTSSALSPLSGRTASPVPAEVVDNSSMGGRVAEHVKSYLDDSEFKRRSTDFTEDMAQADEKRVEHRREVFGHSVGELGTEGVATIASPGQASVEGPYRVNAPAFDLGALFTQPDNLRQAILMQEILQRPEHRWS